MGSNLRRSFDRRARTRSAELMRDGLDFEDQLPCGRSGRSLAAAAPGRSLKSLGARPCGNRTDYSGRRYWKQTLERSWCAWERHLTDRRPAARPRPRASCSTARRDRRRGAGPAARQGARPAAAGGAAQPHLSPDPPRRGARQRAARASPEQRLAAGRLGAPAAGARGVAPGCAAARAAPALIAARRARRSSTRTSGCWCSTSRRASRCTAAAACPSV